jgi:transcriptional regulator of nitric oxide reductase
MKRIVMLLSLVALMVAMMAMTAVAPAFAAGQVRCYVPSLDVYRIVPANEARIYKAELGYTDCRGLKAPLSPRT